MTELTNTEVLEAQRELFRKLAQLDVNDMTEQKNGLTYLSWANAWLEFKKECPDADYDIKKFADDKGIIRPYIADDDLGYIVFTEVTARGKTHEMWLPVMDGANKAMKKVSYTYKVKKYEKDEITKKSVWKGEYEEKEVEPATMFDINKTIMRCLVKNLAMFGLGLYIYSGEDLPFEIGEPCTKGQIDKINALGVNVPNALRNFKKDKLEDLTFSEAEYIIATKQKSLEGISKPTQAKNEGE